MPVRNTVLEFEKDLQDYARQMDLELQLVVKTVVWTLFRKIVQRTPIDTGRAAGNWQVTKGTPNAQQFTSTLGPEMSLARLGKVSFNPPEGVYWIYNNLPYIEVLEFGLYPNPSKAEANAPWGGTFGHAGKTMAGFSIQAPAGMVRISIAELEIEMESALRAAIASR